MSCRKQDIFDRHHVTPKYKGGTNDSENIVRISRTCHAMFHYCNWQLWGNVEDYIAYKGLSSQSNKCEIIKALSSMNGKRMYEEKKGIFSLEDEEKKKYSSIGGKKAGKYMSNSMWINDGTQNKRIPRSDTLPVGWTRGKVKKPKKRYGRTWQEYLDDFDNVYEKRLEYLKDKNLNEWGIKTKIARDWGVSRTQVNRFLSRFSNEVGMGAAGLEPATSR